ncbi:hypothetical protein EV714DRAFT_216659 [Schizophyllum commune]
MHNMGASADMSSCWHENDASNPPSSWAPSTRLPRLKIGSALPPSSLGFPYSATFPESRFRSPVDAEYPFDQALDNPSSSPEGNFSELGLSDSEAPELIEDDGESPPYNPQLLSPVSPELSPEWSPRRIAGASDAEGDGEPSSKAMLLSGGHSRSPYAYGTYEARRDVPIYDYDPHDHAREHPLPGYDDQYAYYQSHLQPLSSDLFGGADDIFPPWSDVPPESPALRSTASLPELDFDDDEHDNSGSDPPPSPARSLISLPDADAHDDLPLSDELLSLSLDKGITEDPASPSPRSEGLLLLDDAPEDQSRSPSPEGPMYLPLPDEYGDADSLDPELRRLCDVQRRAQAAEWEGRQKEAVLLDQGLLQARAEVKRQRKKDKERAREAAALIRLKLASGAASDVEVPSPPPPSSKKAAASSVSQLVARMLLRRHDTTRPISQRRSQAAHVPSPLAPRTPDAASGASHIESLPLTLRLLDS